MFNADPKTLQRIAPFVRRAMVVDPNVGSVRLLSDLLKELGAFQVAVAARTDRALELAKEFEPQLILTEFSGPDLDGLEITRQLRRSQLPARQAPVIMITSEATPSAIIGARNSGVHEFLRKPYTAGDLFRRIENVVLKPRPWIEAVMYVGPDRRRFNSGEYAGSKKRHSDAFRPRLVEAS